MERKIFKIAIIAMLLVCVCATIASALSFSVTMTPSKKVVPASTEFTVEIKVSNPKYVTAKIENATITATNTCNDNNKIKINTNATRNTNTYVTITLKPSDSQNYTKSTIIHNIDKRSACLLFDE